MKKTEIQNPHDVFAREALSKPEVARDLVKNYIENDNDLGSRVDSKQK